jgi:hypothetical protein
MPQLVIRTEQMRILEDDGLRRWICDYLRKAYPSQVARLSAAALGGLMERAIKEARRHGFQEGADIRKYAHVVFLAGPELSDNLPWARKLLASQDFHHSGARARALEDAAIRHLEMAMKGPAKAGKGKER